MEVTGKKKNEQKAHGSSQGSDLPSLHIFWGPRKAVTFLCQVGGAPDHLQAGDSLVSRGGWEKPRSRVGATKGGRAGPAAQRGHGLVASHLQPVHGS